MVKLKIFLADEQDVLRRGLRSLLTTHAGWSVCGETRSGVEAVGLVLELKPDVVIIGVEMAELNGIEVTRQIKRSRPQTEVLFYTVHKEEYLIAEALRAGARGHVLKSDSEETLIEAVRALAKHSPYFSTPAAETLLKHLPKTRAELDVMRVLTERERKIVQLLADGKSNRDIASQFQISPKTVEAHRSAIMRKLRFSSITDLVRYAIRNRLIQP